MSKILLTTSALAVVLLFPAKFVAGQATTVQLPEFGVAIDADGTLSVKVFPDPDGRLFAARVGAAKRVLDDDVFAASKMRKVSLIKLERAVRAKLDAGEAPDDVMKHVAGLQRVQYVFFYPEENDIVVAGPAEGWVAHESGRVVGVKTRRPVVLLEDLIVALRAFPPGSKNKPYIGCSIDPDPVGLARFQEFQRSVPRTVPQRTRNLHAQRIAFGAREALGRTNIRVFGIPATTHFAQVLIECDYRMKLIGIGLEPKPVKMMSFIDALSGGRHAVFNRWWFTPNYDCVRVSDDNLAMELVGQGVQLNGEDRTFTPDGRLIETGIKPGKASHLFTTSFTKKYEDIADKSPVFAQMRNMIDLVVAAAFIRQQDYYGRAKTTLGVFADEAALPVENLETPKHTDCVVNAIWKGNRFFAPASGGVSIRPQTALEQDRLMSDDGGKLSKLHEGVSGTGGERWWWD